MKKKELEIRLQKLDSHPDPSPELEQYMTPGDVAAGLLYLARSHGSIEGRGVYDLGCGTGRLAIGAALLGAGTVTGVDVDREALRVAEKNAERAGVEVEWRHADVEGLELEGADTVVQNPPFGVQRRGADMKFLGKGMELAGEVYSIHKATPKNRSFISRHVEELGGKVTHRIEKDFHIPAQFRFHTRDVYRFKVDLYRIERR
ncbi:hypothetical protein AKJ57_00155 [candidate division MSBL1 archaeon SCGC-AAA259A05]|uniref:Methyltransferase-like protein 5 n=1 Tax=candidate division MSBL1 archaeon SCGC-AAA259A05 TaxID=1698259 RepID=A0A133UC40_9EURY|nr:hypothetical protein AKJ57_00155 [candidate division MSBL1 archaeon SCGC-AAA259A05]